MNTSHRNRIAGAVVACGAALALVAHAAETQPEANPPLPKSRDIVLALRGDQAKQLSMALALPPATEYPGQVKLRPLACDPPGGALTPSNVAVDFWITHAPASTNLCVFSVMIGDAGVSTGFIVPAKDVPEVADNQPVYQLDTGYAIVGGTWPAARGRHSRAGAPGTQFYLEVDGEVERYYLLNQSGTHSVRIRVDGTGGTPVEMTLDSFNDCVEVRPVAGTTANSLTKLPITTMTPEQKKRRNDAADAAKRCKLPGQDPLIAAAINQLKEKKPGTPGDPIEQPGDKPNGGPGATPGGAPPGK